MSSNTKEIATGPRTNVSPKDIIKDKEQTEKQAHDKLMCLVAGKNCPVEDFQVGSGRTIHIPKLIYPGTVPGPSYNGGVTIGEPCKGNHCYIPVSNKVFTEASNRVNMDIPFHNPSLYRPGNNSVKLPIKKYTNNGLNHGPFNIDILQ